MSALTELVLSYIVVSACVRYAAKDAESEDRTAHTTKGRTFVVSSTTPQTSQLPDIDVVDQQKDDDAKRLATPGESKSNNTENVNDYNNITH